MGCLPASLERSRNLRIGARSMHPGGVHVLMCDGSTPFVQDLVDADVWHAMHTRNQSEAVDLPF